MKAMLQKAHAKLAEKGHVFEGQSGTIRAQLLYSARRRAKQTGLAFDLSLSDIRIPDRCPVLQIKLEKALRKSRSRRARINAPSVDRIDPNRGYTKDNIGIISHRANNLKRDGSAEEHIKVAEFMEKMGVTK